MTKFRFNFLLDKFKTNLEDSREERKELRGELFETLKGLGITQEEIDSNMTRELVIKGIKLCKTDEQIRIVLDDYTQLQQETRKVLTLREVIRKMENIM